MARYEYQEGTSSKFWQIELVGSSHTVTFGRIGTEGTKKTKKFPSAAEAKEDHDRLVKEKLGKGYVVAGARAASPTGARSKAVGKARPSGGAPKAKPSKVALKAKPVAVAPKAKPAAVAPKAKPPAAAPKTKPAAVEGFGKISGKALQTLVAKLDKTFDPWCMKTEDIVRKVCKARFGGEPRILWHLVERGLLDAASNPGVLTSLAKEAALPPVEVAFGLLVRIPEDIGVLYRGQLCSCLLPNYPPWLDQLLFHTYLRGRELFAKREGELPSNVRLGVDFVRGRAGDTLPPARKAIVLKTLATIQASGQALGGNLKLPVVKGGKVGSKVLDGPEAVRDIALLFGSREEWNRELALAAKSGDWGWAPDIGDALESASTADVAAILGASDSFRTEAGMQHVIDFMLARKDEPKALLAAALALPTAKRHERQIREMLGLIAAAGFAKRHEPIPEELDELLTFDFPSEVYKPSIPVAVAGLRALPRDRALALMQKGFRAHNGATTVVLCAHFDEALRAECRKQFGEQPVFTAHMGEQGLSPHAEAARATRGEHEAVWKTLAAKAKAGEVIEDKWDAWIRFDDLGGEPLTYWWEFGYEALCGQILNAIPEARRVSLLRARLRDTEYPARVLSAIARHTNDPALVDEAVKISVERRDKGGREELRWALGALGARAVEPLCRHAHLAKGNARLFEILDGTLSAADYAKVVQVAGPLETKLDEIRRLTAVPGKKCRVYVLHVDEESFPVREGSLSRCGGAAPPVPNLPSDGDEPWPHVFTLDLEEVPELKRRYKNARAIAFFVPDTDHGERYEEAKIVPIPQGVAASSTGTGGRPISVIPLDVPTAVFEPGNEEHRDLRHRVFGAAAHVLGGPLWIQDAEDHGDFIMQINEGLGGLNLGDGGSLYVFEDACFMQCH